MFEVGLGAVLAVVLGVLLGAAYLVTRPVLKVKEIPKDAPSSAVYFIEGSRDFDKTVDVSEKRKAFDGGESVDVTEGEINVFLSGLEKPAGKPADKGAPADPKMLDASSFNTRLHNGKIQLADTVTLNAYGISEAVIVQATGTFEKHGSEFEFVPDEFYVGGCPVQRLPFVKDWLLSKLLFTQAVPDDLATAWQKLAEVQIDGSTLRLKMP